MLAVDRNKDGIIDHLQPLTQSYQAEVAIESLFRFTD
jgi:hypothetical protein